MPNYVKYVNTGNVEAYSDDSRYGPSWDDERGPATLAKVGANSKPDFDFTNLGFLMPQNDADEKLYISNQLPHSTKNGTVTFGPHIHYIQDEVAVPTFKIDYRYYNNGTAVPTFTTISSADAVGNVFTYSSGTMLQIMRMPSITVEGVSPSMWYDIIVYRDDNDVTGDVLLKSFDFHRPIDTLGSEQEYAK
jgi:hypothetical protein